MRNVTADERRAVLAIANALPAEQGHQVKADLEISQVEEESGATRLRFVIPGYVRPPYRGQHPFPAEGWMQDADGARLDVILHADEHGRLFELEIIRWSAGEIVSPKWNTFSIYG
jgi:hypothetical protein